MNVSELARQLRVRPAELMQILPQYGFDVGARAVKIDDRVANQVIRRWAFIKREEDVKKKRAAEEKRLKEKELRRESGLTVVLPQILTVRVFAERLGLPVTQVMTDLMKNGILANQNQNIDYDTAAIMAQEFGFTPEPEAASSAQAHAARKEEERSTALASALSGGQNRTPRPPVVVVMGHVDHGKTTLLDAVRKANIAAGESGGITQHIGAYETKWKDPKTKEDRFITFIDTPGHEAFTVMRSRGATVADIAILVVAADDGVKPQTEEVIQIIHAAKLPLVVAINKIDKPGADLQRVKTELSQRNILPEEWGGDVPVVEISAKTKVNIDKLLDVLLLVADMHRDTIAADAGIPAIGTMIESHMDKHTGPVATVLIQAGTLKKNDPLVVNGELYGKVRAMRDWQGKSVQIAGPSVPVQIIGFKVAPEMGDIMDLSRAAEANPVDVKAKRLAQTGAERLMVSRAQEKDEEGELKKKSMSIVIKADVLGSLEAIIGSLEKIQHDEVGVTIIGKGLGNITSDDVAKAAAGEATALGFRVQMPPAVEEAARERNVVFHRFEVIYDLLNWVKAELEKLLPQETIVREVGVFSVTVIFRADKRGAVAGGRVETGKAMPGVLARVRRGGEIVGQGKIALVKSGKREMKEVPSGSECGVEFHGEVALEEGDTLEFYTEESKARKIVFR